MATIKSYTTIEQSRKLAEILPLESADMVYQSVEDEYGDGEWEAIPRNNSLNIGYDDDILCWSLAALINILPNENMLVKTTDGEYYCLSKDVMTVHYKNPTDACVGLILKLNELKML